MEHLKETLQRHKVLHDEAKLKRESKIIDLALHLSEKKATEAEALQKLQQMEEALQSKKESQMSRDRGEQRTESCADLDTETAGESKTAPVSSSPSVTSTHTLQEEVKTLVTK